MHSIEFKAWFEGFSEGIKGTPTKEQWVRIRKRVDEINGVYTSPYVIRQWPYYSYPGMYYTTCQSTSNAAVPISTSNTVLLSAFTEAGRSEAAS